MRVLKIKKILLCLFLFMLCSESFAGFIGSAGLGFGRYRNQYSPKEMSQPAGFIWSASAGYKLFFLSLEGAYFHLSACTENLYNNKEYETCMKDHFYALLSRVYIGDNFNLIVGYALHNITHRVTPNSTAAERHFVYNYANDNSGIAYGLGGKLNLLGSLDAYFDFILFAVGNGADNPSSEVDVFMTGLRYEF